MGRSALSRAACVAYLLLVCGLEASLAMGPISAWAAVKAAANSLRACSASISLCRENSSFTRSTVMSGMAMTRSIMARMVAPSLVGGDTSSGAAIAFDRRRALPFSGSLSSTNGSVIVLSFHLRFTLCCHFRIHSLLERHREIDHSLRPHIRRKFAQHFPCLQFWRGSDCAQGDLQALLSHARASLLALHIASPFAPSLRSRTWSAHLSRSERKAGKAMRCGAQ